MLSCSAGGSDQLPDLPVVCRCQALNEQQAQTEAAQTESLPHICIVTPKAGRTMFLQDAFPTILLRVDTQASLLFRFPSCCIVTSADDLGVCAPLRDHQPMHLLFLFHHRCEAECTSGEITQSGQLSAGGALLLELHGRCRRMLPMWCGRQQAQQSQTEPENCMKIQRGRHIVHTGT